MSERRKYICKDGTRVAGVTDSLKVLAKPALIDWAYRSGVEAARDACIDELRSGFADLSADELKVMFDHLLEQPAHDTKRDTAAEAGTYAHEVFAAELSGTVAPDPPVKMGPRKSAMAVAAAECAARWVRDQGAEVLLVETAMVSENLRVGGTFDCMLRIRGRTYLCDLKTGKRPRKGVYPEWVIQLGAYYGIALECGLPQVDAGLIINAPIDGGLVVSEVSGSVLASASLAFFNVHMAKLALDAMANASTPYEAKP